jgi:2-polyprenyl-3-methyl-5-hydroxy-6-metoxy-1,4-benzoquinol methylase
MSIERRRARSCVICRSTESRDVFHKDGYDLVACTGCGLVFVAAPPDREALAEIYSFESGYHRKFSDETADLSEEIAAARKRSQLITDYRPPGLVLDIGCSAGIFLDQARKDGWQVQGIELSPDTSEIARRRFALDVHTGPLEAGTYAPESFDVVTMWDVIEHLENPQDILAIVHRILKPDGILVCETPNIDGVFPRLSYRIANRINYWPHPEPPGHLFQFSKKTIKKLLMNSDFRTMDIYDMKIPIDYSFGSLASNVFSPKRLVYYTLFAPMAALGPRVGSGDAIVVVAAKQTARAA